MLGKRGNMIRDMSPDRRTKTSLQGADVIVRLLFAAYLFFYFFKSQDAGMTLAQQRLSEGQTVWHPLVGSLVLTALLMLMEHLVGRFCRFRPSLRAFSLVPSAILAVLLANLVAGISTGVMFVSALLGLAWGVLVFFERRTGRGVVSQRTVSQVLVAPFYRLLTLVGVAVYMGVCGGTTDVMDFEVRTSRAIAEGDCEEALRIGERSLATSPRLTALRAYAMSHTPEGMGGHLFAFPLPDGGSEILMLQPGDTIESIFRPEMLYCRLNGDSLRADRDTARIAGGYPINAMTYFEQALQRNPEGPVRDYLLCGLLLDRELERFAAELPRYYTVSDSVCLPQHYAEALILHSRIHPEEGPTYTDVSLITNYEEFKKLEMSLPQGEARRTALWRNYGKTYWWYYYYRR